MSAALESLCLSCALCCNGVLFKDVELTGEDDPVRLKSLGLPVKKSGRKLHFAQPCPALQGCHCRVYAERPVRCREFSCGILEGVQMERITIATAQRTIQTALKQLEKVRRLFLAAGCEETSTALGPRFRQLTRRFEAGGFTPQQNAAYGDLTLAVHDLNQLLHAKFYVAEK